MTVDQTVHMAEFFKQFLFKIVRHTPSMHQANTITANFKNQSIRQDSSDRKGIHIAKNSLNFFSLKRIQYTYVHQISGMKDEINISKMTVGKTLQSRVISGKMGVRYHSDFHLLALPVRPEDYIDTPQKDKDYLTRRSPGRILF